MRDFKINKAVAEKLGVDCSGITVDIQKMYGIPLDYCGSWADAGPIIDQHKIRIQRLANGVCDASSHGSNYSSPMACAFHDSPLVAAMLVFLELDLGVNK